MKRGRAASSTFWRLFSYFKPRRFQYLASLLIVASIFAGERIFTGWIVLLFTDAIANQNLQELGRAVLYWGLFALGMMIFSPIFLYSWRSAIVHGIANLRQAVFNHLQRLPLGYYESRHSGEAMSVLTNDVSASEQAFQQVLIDLFQNAFQGIGAIVFMLFLKWDLALIIILGGIVPLIVNSVAAPRLRKIGHETQDSLAILSERLSDLLAGFQVIRSFNLGDWILNRFYAKSQDVMNVNLKRVRIESGLASANELGSIASLVSYAVGTYMVLDGQVSLGVLFGMIQLNNAVSNFFYSLGSTISRLQSSLAAGDRLLAVLETAPEPETLPAAPLSRPTLPVELAASPGNAFITFEDVSFSYSENQPILQGISFDVLPGQIAALVGPSGSGKSTIFRLLMGHYPASQGLIACQGQPIHSLSLSDWRARFAFVPQDAYLYDGTIQENIRYGRPGASDAEVIEAARASFAHEFILEQPEGYQTRVGERGAHLSGGQRQRIAIARALIKDAPVLLLDEATSALDSESEDIVQEALGVLMKNRTTLAIAHRLSTIEHADVIYVLDQGQIVQQGSHSELFQADGLYRYLYDLQYTRS